MVKLKIVNLKPCYSEEERPKERENMYPFTKKLQVVAERVTNGNLRSAVSANLQLDR